jgi:acid stress-induced BolA-like protein IbaG/YrbA
MVDGDELTAFVQSALPGAVVLVEDPGGRGEAVRLTIVAREFATARAKAEADVRAVLQPALDAGRLRSVELRCYSPEQWQKKNKLLYLE